MKFEVEFWAFGEQGIPIREVHVPDAELDGMVESERTLDLIFKYSQNDVHPSKFRSSSVGDVIQLNRKKYRIEMIGFKRVQRGDDWGD